MTGRMLAPRAPGVERHFGLRAALSPAAGLGLCGALAVPAAAPGFAAFAGPPAAATGFARTAGAWVALAATGGLGRASLAAPVVSLTDPGLRPSVRWCSAVSGFAAPGLGAVV